MSVYERITWQTEKKQQNPQDPAQTSDDLAANCTAAVQQQALEHAEPLLCTSRNT